MSRKGAKSSDSVSESNVPQIGIFTEKGRTATYNRLILQVLTTTGGLETYQLVEKLKEIMSSTDIQETKLEKRYRVQKIYSVIQRKNGRLNDLKSKGYIKEENGKWDITKKGLIAVSIDKPELVNKILQSNKEKFYELSNSMTGKARTIFGMEINLAEIRPLFKKIDFAHVYQLIVEEAKVLLLSGFELDRIDENDFLGIVYNALLTKGKIAEVAKKMAEGWDYGSS